MITQFTVNLNKGEDIAEREARARKRFQIITMTVLTLAVFVMVMINLQQYEKMNGLVQTKENIIRNIDRQLDSLKKTGKNISKEDVMALAKLEKERVLWTKKFFAIGDIMDERMSVTYMEYKNQILLLRFISSIKPDEKEFDQVKSIIDKLRASPLFFRDFVELRLKEQHQSDVETQKILSFSVLCTIEKGKQISSGRRGSRSSGGRAARSFGE